MSLINRHEGCIGIRLWKTDCKFIQLWYCPSFYTIQPHSHPQEDIELMYIFGNTIFWRATRLGEGTLPVESFAPKWYHVFRCFSVKAGIMHSFGVSNWPLIFINFSTFKNGHKPKSAAIDFKL